MLRINESTLDRVIRVVVGLGLIGLAYTQHISWLYVIGALVLLTGVTGFCGLYALFGISSCPRKK